MWSIPAIVVSSSEKMVWRWFTGIIVSLSTIPTFQPFHSTNHTITSISHSVEKSIFALQENSIPWIGEPVLCVRIYSHLEVAKVACAKCSAKIFDQLNTNQSLALEILFAVLCHRISNVVCLLPKMSFSFCQTEKCNFDCYVCGRLNYSLSSTWSPYRFRFCT